MTDDEIRSLSSSMSEDDVWIYTQPECAYCDLARQWLDAHGFQYVECDISADPSCAAAFKSFGATGTPYVVTKRAGNIRHLRNGFTSVEFLMALA